MRILPQSARLGLFRSVTVRLMSSIHSCWTPRFRSEISTWGFMVSTRALSPVVPFFHRSNIDCVSCWRARFWSVIPSSIGLPWTVRWSGMGCPQFVRLGSIVQGLPAWFGLGDFVIGGTCPSWPAAWALSSIIMTPWKMLGQLPGLFFSPAAIPGWISASGSTSVVHLDPVGVEARVRALESFLQPVRPVEVEGVQRHPAPERVCPLRVSGDGLDVMALVACHH